MDGSSHGQQFELEADIPDLSISEMEARRRVVTMMEVDQLQPQLMDDWGSYSSFMDSADNLPRITVDQFDKDSAALPKAPSEQFDMDQELGSVLQDPALSDVSAVVPPLPLRPSAATDSQEVTPTVQEERKRRSPLLPDLMLDSEAETPREQTEEAEEGVVIQPPAAPEEEPSSLELPEVTETAKPPPKKKKKLSQLKVDEVWALSRDQIKSQMSDYQDILRENVVPSRPALSADQLLNRAPGRALGLSLGNLCSGDLTATSRFSDRNFDWPEEDAVPQLPEEELDYGLIVAQLY